MTIQQVRKNEFCMEVKIENGNEGADLWLIFVCASIDARVRKQQWDLLRNKRRDWGSQWVMGRRGEFH